MRYLFLEKRVSIEKDFFGNLLCNSSNIFSIFINIYTEYLSFKIFYINDFIIIVVNSCAVLFYHVLNTMYSC